ncbi:hypothetical protein ACQP2F_35495 [Actinoplanes sp. CA-030573]|uniref:hypothetical protein n=1 Tax=Actinoplanes sp. CA-030573 TaxID=3239898 RepID=UPI003D8EB4E7
MTEPRDRSRWVTTAVFAAAAVGAFVLARARRRPATRPAIEAPSATAATPATTAPPVAGSPTGTAPVAGPPAGRATAPRGASWAALLSVAAVAAAGGVVATVTYQSAHRPAPIVAQAARIVTAPTTPSAAVLIPPVDPWASPAPPSWTPAPGPSSPAAVPAGGIVPRDGTVVLRRDNGDRMQVSLGRIEDPELSSFPELEPAAGNRLMSIQVHVSNTGSTPFPDDVETSPAWVIDDQGRSYERNATMTAAMQAFPAAPLEPAWEISRPMVFEVKASARLIRFRLGAWAGVSSQSQDWELT